MAEDARPRRRAMLAMVAAAAAVPALSSCSDHAKAKTAAATEQPVGALAAASSSAGPQVLMMIRHAEKPTGSGSPYGVTSDGDKDDKSLTVQGWTRAGALAGLFAPRTATGAPATPRPGLTRPTSVYAADPSGASKRPWETVTPVAAVLGGTPDTQFAKGQEAQLASALLAASGDVLVAWEHESIPAIVAHLGSVTPTPPATWPDARFDVVWVFTRQGDGWNFSQVPQMLLAGDLPTPIS
ncbi:hypothetical protein ACIGXM_21880 [Kitasatospora sp. NPDC052896]|uniref:hypothetical protein n=1 Tax=Kitasatospora sp. NPDC052896 TaxID=3364061 RepID=UPI0037C5F522